MTSQNHSSKRAGGDLLKKKYFGADREISETEKQPPEINTLSPFEVKTF